jgi:hypothetical protein
MLWFTLIWVYQVCKEREMSLVERATGKIDVHRRVDATLTMPLLKAAIRERAAFVMNEPRFREFSSERSASPSVAPIFDSPQTSATPQLRSILVALCSMGLGAIVTFTYLGGHRDVSPSFATSRSIEQVSMPGNASRDTLAILPMPVIVPAIDARAEAIELVGQWAAAWSQRNVERYLNFYSKSFVPPDNNSLEAWEDKRRARILGKRRISVMISDLGVELLDDNRAIARFAQTYEADNYRETRTTKFLILAREGNEWRIAAEMNPHEASLQIAR